MDEPMTPMERLVVEYHVWKTQLFKPANMMLAHDHCAEFMTFKQQLGLDQSRDLNARVQDAWKAMNSLDLGKALGEYEADCPDLSNLGVESVKHKTAKN